MIITAEMIAGRKAQAQAELERLQATGNIVLGVIRDCEYWEGEFARAAREAQTDQGEPDKDKVFVEPLVDSNPTAPDRSPDIEEVYPKPTYPNPTGE